MMVSGKQGHAACKIILFQHVLTIVAIKYYGVNGTLTKLREIRPPSVNGVVPSLRLGVSIICVFSILILVHLHILLLHIRNLWLHVLCSQYNFVYFFHRPNDGFLYQLDLFHLMEWLVDKQHPEYIRFMLRRVAVRHTTGH